VERGFAGGDPLLPDRGQDSLASRWLPDAKRQINRNPLRSLQPLNQEWKPSDLPVLLTCEVCVKQVQQVLVSGMPPWDYYSRNCRGVFPPKIGTVAI
jgi:hypothetical protein